LTFQAVLLAALWVVLMIMIVVDLEYYIIPDGVHLALLPLGLGYHAVLGTPQEDVVMGFLIGAGTGLSLHHGYRIIRGKEGLGFGDVKFLAVAGVWLGVMPFVPFMFYAGVFGVVLGLAWRAMGQGEIFPFGPALALSLFLCIVSNNAVNVFWNIGEIIKITFL
jgi:prepilin signal peptidase PulO-like enzyme (type II secretory pathway)